MRRSEARLTGAAALAAALLAAPAPGGEAPEAAAPCAACHGADGVSETPETPSLAGQPEFFLFDQLFLMREGVRRVAEMEGMVDGLDDAALTALARHYAAQPPRLAGPGPDPELAARGATLAVERRCASCHGAALGGHDNVPRLAGQRIDYLAAALRAYRDGTRRSADTLMSASIRGLSDAELDALAHHAARPEG